MKINGRKFLDCMKELNLRVRYKSGRIKIFGKDHAARDYYRAMLKNPELEEAVILELSQTDPDVKDAIEERRAIRWVECEDDSIMERFTVT